MGVANPNLGEEDDLVGDGRPTVRKSVEAPPPYSNFSSIFTRFRYIAAFVLQNATFLTPPLVSPKFPHVPMGVGGSPSGYKERMCCANSLCN